jgi:tetraacyldisaccharide 4'-kinase
MIDTDPNSIRAIMSGSAKGLKPALLRSALSIAAPFYAGAMRLRNAAYDAGAFKSHDLSRPTIAFGNITTGGTGKTPLVRWAAEQLRAVGIHVGILSRGYGSTRDNPLGDELTMLCHQLNDGQANPIPLIAARDRVAGAAKLLAEHAQTQAILLDDAFQHRRARRKLNIVLINATEPFGFGHVLPRGLLREPLRGLCRADAVVLTHVNRVSECEILNLESEILRFAPSAPIYCTSHKITGVLSADQSLPLDALRDKKVFGFCGIGTPAAFNRDISELSTRAGFRAFDDHHEYSKHELNQLQTEASEARADLLVTTEKDWVKLAPIVNASLSMPIWRLEMRIAFESDHEARLLQQMKEAIAGANK